MKRSVIVEIDCEDEYCGLCRRKWGRVCDEYNKFLRWNKSLAYRRCPACKRAERGTENGLSR